MRDSSQLHDVFTEIRLKNIGIKNRVVRSATNDYAGNTDGSISDYQIDICKELAKNEVGLLITANFYVSYNGRADRFQNSADNDCFIPGMKRLVRAVKAYDCKIVAQINHSGPKATCEDGLPLAPSEALRDDGSPAAKAILVKEIEEVSNAFIQAAYRLKCAGFDGVQLHCAHGYLLSQFISPMRNKRMDLYGGSIENRFRMAGGILRGIKSVCGKDFPVFIKVDSNLPEEDEAYVGDLIYILNQCKELGIEAVELSGCDFISFDRFHPPYYLQRAADLKKAADMPVILVGGIRSLDDMQQVMQEGIDMVSMSRPFICEPDLLPRLIAGQKTARCLSCNKCFTLYKTDRKRCVFSK